MTRVLFVCTGNVCRSPMAAALFRRATERRGEADRWQVDSAGTWALDGQPASGLAQMMMAKREISVAAHRAHTVTPGDIETSSVVLVMTENHLHALRAEFPAHRGKFHLLSELDGQTRDIFDPYGGSHDEYAACAADLESLIDKGYPRVVEWALTDPSNQAVSREST